MITRKAIIDAWTSIRRLNDTIPDEVIDFLRDAAIEKHERLLKPTTVEEMESSGHSFTEGMDIGATKRCTQPNCDCVEQAEQKAGGPVKSYQCLAPTEPPRMKSAFTPHEPTIAEQITWLEAQLATKELGHTADYFRSMIKVLSRIERTKKELNSLQQFVLEWTGFRTLEYDPKTNEHSIHGERKVDIRKVVEALIADLKLASGLDCRATASVINAEAALGMIDAFKQKSSPPEWVKNFAQVKTVTRDETQWTQYPKEMQKKIEDFDLRGMLVDRMLDVQGKYAIADAIIMAIELKCNGANRA